MRNRPRCTKPPIELAAVLRRRGGGTMGACGSIRLLGGRAYLIGAGAGGQWIRRVVCERVPEPWELMQ